MRNLSLALIFILGPFVFAGCSLYAVIAHSEMLIWLARALLVANIALVVWAINGLYTKRLNSGYPLIFMMGMNVGLILIFALRFWPVMAKILMVEAFSQI